MTMTEDGEPTMTQVRLGELADTLRRARAQSAELLDADTGLPDEAREPLRCRSSWSPPSWDR